MLSSQESRDFSHESFKSVKGWNGTVQLRGTGQMLKDAFWKAA